MSINWTGKEVTKNGARGIVVDGIPKLRGPNKDRIEVMWVGASWTVAEDPSDLALVVEVFDLEAKLAYARKGRTEALEANRRLREEINGLKLTLGSIRKLVNGA
jgi:hypothetical protein